VAGQVFCTFEAPGTMATCVVEFVHMVSFKCMLERWLEVLLE
jgi:hypothetical protein